MKWRIAKASVIGTGHIKAGMPCQDSHYVRQSGDTLIIAVSDGLGSAAHSDQGSALVCKVVTEHIARHLEPAPTPLLQRLIPKMWRPEPSQPDIRQLLHDAFAEARQALQHKADSQQLALREFACTLLVAVVTPAAWYTLHIGDGAIVGIYADQSAITLSQPDNGEFINVTVPLTSIEYTKHLRYTHKAEGLSGIALLSDGVQPMCINYRTGSAFPGFFQPMANWLGSLADLSQADHSMTTMLDSEKFRQKSDDDMTLVLAHRDP